MTNGDNHFLLRNSYRQVQLPVCGSDLTPVIQIQQEWSQGIVMRSESIGESAVQILALESTTLDGTREISALYNSRSLPRQQIFPMNYKSDRANRSLRQERRVICRVTHGAIRYLQPTRYSSFKLQSESHELISWQ